MANTSKKSTLTVRVNDTVYTINYSTIPRKDGRLQVYIPNGFKPDNTIKYKQIYGRSVLELADKVEAFLKNEEAKKPNNTLFRNDILQWFYDVKARNMRNSSADSMEATIKCLIIKNLDDDVTLDSFVRTVDMTGNICRKLLNNLFDAGKSHSYVNKAYIFLNQFFKYSFNNGFININPMITVSIPSKERFEEKRSELGIIEKNRRYLTKKEIEKIQEVIYNGYQPIAKSRSGNEYKMEPVVFEQAEAFDFMLNTGLRAGEMLALTYADWDQEKRTITVNKNRVRVGKRDSNNQRTGETFYKEGKPKTPASLATIPITKNANDILLSMLKKEKRGYSGYIIHNKEYQPLGRDGLRGRWLRLCTAAGIIKKGESIGLHIMRHTFTSYFLYQTKDLTLTSKLLRHSDVNFTANVYSDLVAETVDTIADVVIGKNKSKISQKI